MDDENNDSGFTAKQKSTQLQNLHWISRSISNTIRSNDTNEVGNDIKVEKKLVLEIHLPTFLLSLLFQIVLVINNILVLTISRQMV